MRDQDLTFGQTQFFARSYDSATTVISAIVCAICVVVAVATGSFIVAGLEAAILILCYGYSPRDFVLAERSVVVSRLFGDVRIPLDGIRGVRAATSDDFRGTIRLWGNGGLFGYYGLFRTSKLGKCTWYVTNRNDAVVILTAAKTVLISPHDVDRFLTAIRLAVPAPTTAPEDLAGTGHIHAPSIGIWIGAAIGVVALAIALFAIFYSPGPPRLTLTPAALTIHDRFYPVTLDASDVDVAHAGIVDITTDPNWRPTLRTNGFANAHYHSGWYRVAGGQKVRMYRADGTRLVLLPPKAGGGPAVLLEVNNPEQFLDKLRRVWGKQS